jgi:hypothetical protein
VLAKRPSAHTGEPLDAIVARSLTHDGEAEIVVDIHRGRKRRFDEQPGESLAT